MDEEQTSGPPIEVKESVPVRIHPKDEDQEGVIVAGNSSPIVEDKKCGLSMQDSQTEDTGLSDRGLGTSVESVDHDVLSTTEDIHLSDHKSDPHHSPASDYEGVTLEENLSVCLPELFDGEGIKNDQEVKSEDGTDIKHLDDIKQELPEYTIDSSCESISECPSRSSISTDIIKTEESDNNETPIKSFNIEKTALPISSPNNNKRTVYNGKNMDLLLRFNGTHPLRKNEIRNSIRRAVMSPESLKEALEKNELDMSSMLSSSSLLVTNFTEEMTEAEKLKRVTKLKRAKSQSAFSDVCLSKALNTQEDLDRILHYNGVMPFRFSPPPPGFHTVTEHTEAVPDIERRRNIDPRKLIDSTFSVYDFEGDCNSLESSKSSMNSLLTSPQNPGSCSSSLNGTIDRLHKHLISPDKKMSIGLPMTSPGMYSDYALDSMLSPNSMGTPRYPLPSFSDPGNRYSTISNPTGAPLNPEQLITELLNLRKMLQQAEEMIRGDAAATLEPGDAEQDHLVKNSVPTAPSCNCRGINGKINYNNISIHAGLLWVLNNKPVTYVGAIRKNVGTVLLKYV